MTPKFRVTLSFLFAGLALFASTGCTNNVTTGHEQAVNAANERWQQMRGRMMIQTAQRQFDTGDLDQAEKTLAESLKIDPKNVQMLILIGRVNLERGQLDSSYKFFQTVIGIDDKNPLAHYYQGVILQRWQQFEAALIAYDRAYSLAQDNAGYLLAKAEMLVQLDRYQEAIALLTERQDFFDQNVAMRLAIAHIHQLQKHPAQAAELYREALTIKPDDASIIEDLATAEIASGQADKAITRLEDLMKQSAHGQRRDLQRLLARAYEAQGRAPMAKHIYIQLTRTDPKDADAWQRLGEICWAMKDQQGAGLSAKRCLALDPNRYQAHLLLGLASQAVNSMEEAIQAYQRASELAPQDAQALILQGLALEKTGHPKLAAQAYKEALRRQPNEQNAIQLLARVETGNP